MAPANREGGKREIQGFTFFQRKKKKVKNYLQRPQTNFPNVNTVIFPTDYLIADSQSNLNLMYMKRKSSKTAIYCSMTF